MAVRLDVQQGAVGADAGIDHGEMNGPRCEAGEDRAQEVPGVAQVLRRDFMTEVKHARPRIDAEDDAFQGSDVRRSGAEVGGQGDERIEHNDPEWKAREDDWTLPLRRIGLNEYRSRQLLSCSWPRPR